MRLIDADVLQNKFEGLKEKDSHATGRNAYDLCAMLTEDAPTIDAVPVVRCKDCKYHNKAPCPMRLSFNWTNDSDFCSYGMRKENNND